MKYNSRTALLLFLALLLVSCKPEIRKIELFDLNGLIKKQEELLNNSKATVVRISVMNNIADTLKIESYLWKEELKSLNSLDLNGSKYKTDYKKEEGKERNLNYLKYSLDLPMEDFTGINEFKVWYQDDLDNPDRIEIHQKASNLVYRSSHIYQVSFSDRNGSHLIKSFKITGEQDLMMKKPVSYEVRTSEVKE